MRAIQCHYWTKSDGRSTITIYEARNLKDRIEPQIRIQKIKQKAIVSIGGLAPQIAGLIEANQFSNKFRKL